MKAASCVLLVCLSTDAIAHAAEVGVRYDKGTYYLNAEFDVDASPARVMQVLTDYENIAELNPAITLSELLESSDNTNTRIRTVVHDCIMFFCKDITRVENVQQDGNERLEAVIVPMLSDLRSGHAVWMLTESPFGTTVKYDAEMQPKFWVPPIIRSYVLTKKFRTRVAETVERLQAVTKTK